MLALEPILKARLEAVPELTGWVVYGASDLSDRTARPSIDVRCGAANVPESKTGGVRLAPAWVVTLAVRRSAAAAESLDAAFSSVLKTLQAFVPGAIGGHYWAALLLSSVRSPEFFDEGLVGLEMTFTTGAVYATARETH